MLLAGGQEITQPCPKRKTQGTPPFDADLSSEPRPAVGHSFIHSNKAFILEVASHFFPHIKWTALMYYEAAGGERVSESYGWKQLMIKSKTDTRAEDTAQRCSHCPACARFPVQTPVAQNKNFKIDTKKDFFRQWVRNWSTEPWGAWGSTVVVVLQSLEGTTRLFLAALWSFPHVEE